MKKVSVRSIGFWLIVLAGVTLASMNLHAQTTRGGGVPPESLPESLKTFDIKDYFVSSSFKKAGVIHALTGHVVVVHKATGEAYFGGKGDRIFENDSLNTLADSRCRITLLTKDVVTMAPDTVVSVDTFLDRKKEGKKTSIFSMAKGMAKFHALRLFRYRESKFNVKTPTAVVGVRGTEFILHVYPKEGEKRAGGAIMVADSGDDVATYLMAGRSGQKGRCMDTFVNDGVVDVNGTPVRAGNMFICQELLQVMSQDDWLRLNCFVDPECHRGRGEGPQAGDGKPKEPPFDPSDPNSQHHVKKILDRYKGEKKYRRSPRRPLPPTP
ncbi:MAG: FecR domain-containing protein [Deltaproteobacteria bacterium]|nr:FecR domain-containing protein [Deltaproteobacteria bacterium]